MGLDMYLTAKRYLYRKGDEAIVDAINKADTGANGMRPKEISFEAMYWRKANAIHGWFVENVQDGADDCEEYEVTTEQLKELADACKRALADPTNAAEILPPTSGFFFGSKDLDEWFFESLKETADTIDKLLANPSASHFYFYYQSSW